MKEDTPYCPKCQDVGIRHGTLAKCDHAGAPSRMWLLDRWRAESMHTLFYQIGLAVALLFWYLGATPSVYLIVGVVLAIILQVSLIFFYLGGAIAKACWHSDEGEANSPDIPTPTTYPPTDVH